MKKAILIAVIILAVNGVPSPVFATSCNRIGNTTFCDDGTSYNQIGNTVFGSDGSSYNRIGNTTFSNNGTSCNRIGNTTFCSDGTSYNQIGNTTFGSDGSTYNRIGNTTFSNGGSNIINTCPANSSYNSSTGKCSCNYGYGVNYDKTSCIYTGTYTAPTTPTCPLNAFYNGSSCTCNYGYVASGSVCITTTQSCQNTYGLYSYGSGSSCYCSSGYAFNSSKTACVAQSSIYIAPPVSPTTYTPSASAGASCSSFGAGGVLKGSLCYCAVGYKWNTAITACVAGSTVLQRNLSVGSSGSDVIALKNLLAILNLYTGYVSTPFDTDTATAVGLFQVAHNLPWTGTVGPMTRKVINGLISGS